MYRGIDRVVVDRGVMDVQSVEKTSAENKIRVVSKKWEEMVKRLFYF
jgi:hypothetical protein